MISRLLRGGGEPRSIFEHIDAHVRPGVPGLTEGGEILPDDGRSPRDLRFAPGALEGVLGTGAATVDDEEAVERIYAALAALARKPSQQHRKRLRELFREGRVRSRIDLLRDRLTAESPPQAVELYPELHELFLRSGYRDEVKYAMALMSGFGRPDDADLFRIVGRHEEFTLYAAIALATVTGDPVGEWLGLLPHVSGWGRTELAELILREPRSQEVRERLVRDGLGVGNALTLARECRLAELLAPPEVDVDLLAGARAIVDALLWQWDSPATLTDYEEAGPALEALVRQIRSRPQGLPEFLTLFELRRLLTADPAPEALEACGFDTGRIARVVASCDELLANSRWPGSASAALESADAAERSLGMSVAERLGLDLHDYLRARLVADPGDQGLWAQFVDGADGERMREAVALALEQWDLDDIARGAALDLFGGEDGPLAAVGWLLQELVRFPGLGGPLLAAALESPVVRDRLLALAALARWDHVPAGLLELLVTARAKDPDEQVRAGAARVLSGEPIAEG